jgi:hypothetical protein
MAPHRWIVSRPTRPRAIDFKSIAPAVAPASAPIDDPRPAREAGKEIAMLEKYFRRIETLDQIRASWIGPGVERYVAWLDEHHYAARVVFARVPTVMHFGRFAAGRGANTRADLPAHGDASLRCVIKLPCKVSEVWNRVRHHE